MCQYLDEKSGLNSDPFVILAKSAESADTDHNQFEQTNEKHSQETVEIVTAANVGKEKPVVISHKTKNEEKLNPVNGNTSKVPDTSHWVIESSFNLSSSLAVVKYKSSLTGLTIVLAKAESPIVNGYFCLATEATDNDGLPHTLEHLIFLGSEDYPNKEVLDLLANRCLADRTNA